MQKNIDVRTQRKKNRKLFLKKTIKKISLCIVVIIFFAFFVFGVPIAINEAYKCSEGYLTLWDAADVLAFYSVILSGLITIVALIVTINYNRKETEKQIKFSKSQTNTPFFIIERVSDTKTKEDFNEFSNSHLWKREYIRNKYLSEHGEVFISLRNIGDGIAISPSYIVGLEPNTNESISKFVNKGESIEIIFNLQKNLEAKFGEKSFINESQSFNICITLSYLNSLGIKFSQEIVFQHDCIDERNSVILTVNSISPQNIEL